MKINCQEEVRDIENKPMKFADGALTVGRALSAILLNHNVGGRYKMFILGQKFVSQKAVEVDKADLELIRSAVADTTAYVASDGSRTFYATNTTVVGRLTEVLDQLKKDD